MIEIDIRGLHTVAQKRANNLPVYRGSMRGKRANEVGCMGELVVMRYFNMCDAKYADTPNSNHNIQTEYGVFNVKAKERTVVPQKHYECSVQKSKSTAQLPDWYIFVSLMCNKDAKGCGRFTRAWVLGTIMAEDFYATAKVVHPGGEDISNGWAAKIPCYNIPISSLRPPREQRQAEPIPVCVSDFMG